MGNNDNRVVTWKALNSFITENGGTPLKATGATSLALRKDEFPSYAPMYNATTTGIVISDYTGISGGAYANNQLVIEKDVTWRIVKPVHNTYIAHFFDTGLGVDETDPYFDSTERPLMSLYDNAFEVGTVTFTSGEASGPWHHNMTGWPTESQVKTITAQHGIDRTNYTLRWDSSSYAGYMPEHDIYIKAVWDKNATEEPTQYRIQWDGHQNGTINNYVTGSENVNKGSSWSGTFNLDKVNDNTYALLNVRLDNTTGQTSTYLEGFESVRIDDSTYQINIPVVNQDLIITWQCYNTDVLEVKSYHISTDGDENSEVTNTPINVYEPNATWSGTASAKDGYKIDSVKIQYNGELDTDITDDTNLVEMNNVDGIVHITLAGILDDVNIHVTTSKTV